MGPHMADNINEASRDTEELRRELHRGTCGRLDSVPRIHLQADTLQQRVAKSYSHCNHRPAFCSDFITDHYLYGEIHMMANTVNL